MPDQLVRRFYVQWGKRKSFGLNLVRHTRCTRDCAQNRKAAPNRSGTAERAPPGQPPGRLGFFRPRESCSTGSWRRDRSGHGSSPAEISLEPCIRMARKKQAAREITISCSTAFAVPLKKEKAIINNSQHI